MILKRLQVLGVLLIALLAGCGNAPAQPQPQPQPINRLAVPTPSAGMSVVAGQVVGSGTAAPIKKTPIYLAQVHWDDQHKNAAYALDISRSPATTTDQNGFFVFSDLPPDEYTLIVGDFYGRNDVVREKNGNARIFQPEAGKTLDVEVVQVNPLVEIPRS
jgi:hypothetical protein